MNTFLRILENVLISFYCTKHHVEQFLLWFPKFSHIFLDFHWIEISLIQDWFISNLWWLLILIIFRRIIISFIFLLVIISRMHILFNKEFRKSFLSNCRLMLFAMRTFANVNAAPEFFDSFFKCIVHSIGVCNTFCKFIGIWIILNIN